MKLLIILLLFCVSCQKELSGEFKRCGNIVDKNIDVALNHTIDVNYSGTIVRESVGALHFFDYEIGDTFCK